MNNLTKQFFILSLFDPNNSENDKIDAIQTSVKAYSKSMIFS